VQKILGDIDKHVAQAVSHYWLTRKAQKDKQNKRGISDAGSRSAVTGGTQMDGFITLFKDLIFYAGIDKQHIHEKKALELPGFFRPTKEWDLLVIKNGQLIVAIEANPKWDLHSEIISTTGPKRLWEVPLIYGQLLEREPSMLVFSLSSAISLCLKIVRPQIDLLK